MWKITKDKIFDTSMGERSAVGFSSQDYDGRALPYRFRMLDDDGEIYYYGLSSSDSSFAPLDSFGMPNAGCTMIEYYNVKTKKWEIL
ncbi:hypothetical protein [Sporomusa sphaeroides]|uniref:Uncharacterized protein n=1 Tax=Sporomusa sphaeroides DSM 2875 TaxID=1337886 RepID=A0A1U7M9Y6_9FIRM|nr:hypothetical protein [Sporomusa sphaeroides]OLS54332.1 hypothetical protein SPSPH_45780 [Sporomusa sphaeroides DSM 2875]CVK21561.1 hypothetical protein SSPH_04253 [Sporomusa sphaeroides DSM 2875]